jgi:hypothetical protein
LRYGGTDAPRSRIDIQAWIELAVLLEAAKLRVVVAAAQGPRAAAGALVVFEYLDLVTGAAEFVCSDEPGHAGAEHEH